MNLNIPRKVPEGEETMKSGNTHYPDQFAKDSITRNSTDLELIVQKAKEELTHAKNVEEKVDIINKYWTINRDGYIDFLHDATLEAIEEAKKENEPRVLGLAHFIFGWIKLDTDLYEEGLFHFKTAYSAFVEDGDKHLQARALNGEASAYRYCGQFDKALEKFLIGLELTEEMGELDFAGILSSNIGTLLIDLKQYEEALGYFTRANILEKPTSINTAIQLQNMTKAYRCLGKYEKAEKCIMKAIELCEEKDSGHTNAICHLELGLLRYCQSNIGEAKKYLATALEISNEQNLLKHKGSALLQLGIIEETEGSPKKALPLLLEARKIFKAIGSRTLEALALRAVSKVYDLLGESKTAYRKLEEYKDIEEEVYNEDTINKMGILRVQQIRRENLIYKDLYNRINTISRIGQAITATFDIKEIGGIVYQDSKSLMKVENLAIGLFSEDKKKITYRICIKDGKYLPEFVLPIEKSNQLEGRCVAEKKGFILNDLAALKEYNDARDRWAIGLEKRRINSLVCSPLTLRGNMMGLISVGSMDKNAYLPHHEDILRALAAFTAIALENEKLFSHVNELATTDSLTGLVNRRRIFEYGECEFTRYKIYKSPLSVVMIDIDKFKSINDTYGHVAGDVILKNVSQEFLGAIRTTDILGRIGGDEFLLILPDTNLEEAMEMARRIHNTVLKKSYNIDGGWISIKACLGVAELNLTDDSIEDAVKRADLALYMGKRAGGNVIRKAKNSLYN